MSKYKFNGIVFDDVTHDEDQHAWSQICEKCKDKYNFPTIGCGEQCTIDNGGTGICGIEGCSNESEYYVDFWEDILKVSKEYKVKKICPKCGNELIPETVIKQYPLQCLECDENFFDFEAVIQD